jgi:hypothetical protein
MFSPEQIGSKVFTPGGKIMPTQRCSHLILKGTAIKSVKSASPYVPAQLLSRADIIGKTTSRKSFLAPDGTLKAFVSGHYIQVRNIATLGPRRHNIRRIGEKFKYGTAASTNPNSAEIEAAVVDTLIELD